VIGGVLPVIVPWAAALGGVTNALYGLVFHWSQYRGDTAAGQAAAADQRWRWSAFYPTRIILGAIFGTVATLIVVYVTKSVEIGTGVISGAGIVVLFVIAFVVGFRQDYFKELIKRVAAIILATPDKDEDARAPKKDGAVLVIDGSTAYGPVAVGSPQTFELWVANRTDRTVDELVATVSGKDAAAFSVNPTDGALKPLPAGMSRVVEVAFTPDRAGTFEATLEVRRSGTVTASVVLTGTGVAASADRTEQVPPDAPTPV
jgi:hypothetical protein